MARKRVTAKGRREGGLFVAFPISVLSSHEFGSLSPRATKLLFDLLSQLEFKKGDGVINNGDLSCAWSVMRERGWKSRDTLGAAQRELEESGFILRTRQGGRHRANLFAITFFAIDYCDGKLDVPATAAPPGTWRKQNS